MENDKLSTFYHWLDRSFFLEEEYKSCAGLDGPLPIGFEQTISQPSLVLEMTRMLELDKSCKVLEIGTGSGYQTVFLAEFAGSVYTVERIKELSEKARKRLEHLGYTNIRFKVGDGSVGWSENGPYDRIIVTAAAGRIPRELVDQLKEGGKMIVPVGLKGWQDMTSIFKDARGEIHVKSLGPVTFVELKGPYGWTED
ncbi:MAG TPA: protein-L-isoaspartate(D-aspartate) O-methyltransferase [Clostridia bacterium]|nr:protein-L-isoaspartate(D-aspartate) O-methyltransferase [Clostridia bacterium]